MDMVGELSASGLEGVDVGVNVPVGVNVGVHVAVSVDEFQYLEAPVEESVGPAGKRQRLDPGAAAATTVEYVDVDVDVGVDGDGGSEGDSDGNGNSNGNGNGNAQGETAVASLALAAQNMKKVHNEQWNEMLERLKAYRAQHGDCLVPKRYPADPKVGSTSVICSFS